MFVATAVDALGYADFVCRYALVGEFRGILDEKDRTFTAVIASARGGEVTAEDVALFDAFIGKKPVGRLRVRPILASERDALTHGIAHLLQQLAKTSPKTRVFESGFIDLALRPMFRGAMLPEEVVCVWARRVVRFHVA